MKSYDYILMIAHQNYPAPNFTHIFVMITY